MRQETIEGEAESLEEALSRLQARIPPGMFLVSRDVLANGAPTKVRAVGVTVEQALSTATSSLPTDAAVIDQKILHSPVTHTYTFEAVSETEAKRRADSHVSRTTKLLNLTCTKSGRKGVLGMGRRLDQYQAEVLDLAEVEVTSKQPARVRGQVRDHIASWSDLLAAIRTFGDPLANPSLLAQYPHQSLYVGFRLKQEASYFTDLPFAPVTPALLAAAQRYVEDPPVPMLVAMSTSSKLAPDRYAPQNGGQITRTSNAMLDVCITQVVSCLAQYGPIDALDQERVCRLAYEAIRHYASLPMVEYFFALPYLDAVLRSQQFSPTEAQISVFKGVEGLLLELYEEFRDGRLIRDRTLIEKVHSFWTS